MFFESDKSLFLLLTIFIPLCTIIILFFISSFNLKLIKQVSLFGSILTFFFSLFLWLGFDHFNTSFQFTCYINWFSFYNINYSLGIDGISLLFIILTTFLIPLCILMSWNNIQYRLKEYMCSLLITEFFLLNIFCSLDLFFFLYFF